MFRAFSGRDREVSELLGAVDAAVAGRGSLFLIEGEPGIGKTRLAEEVAGRAAESEGVRVLWGHCRENGGAPPFWPWVQVLRALADLLPDDVLESALAAGAPYIARAMPDVVRRLPGVVAAPEAEHASFALFDSLVTFLVRVTEDRPLMLILDDVHAADPPSLDLLEFLAPDIAHMSMVTVCAVRGPEAQSPDTTERLTEISRHAQIVSLGGLDREAVGEIISTFMGPPASGEVVDEIYQLTEGHPLFVRELVRLLRTRGERGAVGSITLHSLPASIRQAIRARLAPLSPETRGILEGAAVLGRRFEGHILAATADTSHEEVFAGLAGAVTAGIVEEEADDWYSFAHALFREVIYQELSHPRRTRLHRRAGETLEEMFGGQAEGRLADIAHHFLQVAADGEAERAVAYATRAGEWAVDHLAYGEAVRHFENALGALEWLPANPRRRGDILLALGEARFRSGQGQRARTTFEEALHLARETNDGPRLARAAVGYAPWDLSGGIVDESRVDALEEALAALDPDEHRLRSEILSRLAVELYFADPIDRADDLSVQAVEEARNDGDPSTLSKALIARHFVLWRPLGAENLKQRLRLGREIQDLTHQVGDPELKLRGRIWYLQNLLEAGEMTAFDRELNVFSRIAEEIRHPAYLSLIPAWQATRSLLRGDFDTAEEYSQTALEIGQRIHTRLDVMPIVEQTFGVQQYFLYRERGSLAELEGMMRSSVEAFPNVTGWRAGLALLYAETGRLDDAVREFERLAADGVGSVRRDAVWFNAMALLATVCTSLGDKDRAELLYRSIFPFVESHVVVGWAVAYMGSFAHYLGMLAATMGRFGDAEAHFVDALVSHRRMGAGPWVARTEYHYAHMLFERGGSGNREQARVLAASSLSAARSMGMEELAGRVEALVAETGESETVELVMAGGGGASSPSAEKTDRSESNVVAFPSSKTEAVSEAKGVFRREGDYWTVAYGKETLRLKDSKGLGYLAELLRHPGREVHVLDLVAGIGGVSPERATVSETAEAGLHPHGESPLEAADATARAAYRRRIEDLETEIGHAETRGDHHHAASLRSEQEILVGELAAALGLNRGRSSPQAERARVAVTNALRRTLRRLYDQSPNVADHFEQAITTGLFCSYKPPHGRSITWQL